MPTRSTCRAGAVAALLTFIAGCGGPLDPFGQTRVTGMGEEGSVGDDTPVIFPPPGELGPDGDPSPLVEEYVTTACSTYVLRPLSEQLLEELNCLQPDVVSPIPMHPRIDVGEIFDYLQTSAADALIPAVEARPGATLKINSALRSLAQQYLLYRWYQAGRCGIALAASPGTSNHERGMAVDVADNQGWRNALQANGYSWLGANDPVHYDYVGGGTSNISGTSVLAFQILWNLNNPNDLIDEDGQYGSQTGARLAQSPVWGFPVTTQCAGEALLARQQARLPPGQGAAFFE